MYGRLEAQRPNLMAVKTRMLSNNKKNLHRQNKNDYKTTIKSKLMPFNMAVWPCRQDNSMTEDIHLDAYC